MMDGWNTSDPHFMGAVLAGTIGVLIIVIAMDARKAPPGKTKMMPWTMLTIVLVFCVVLEVRTFLLDLVH